MSILFCYRPDGSRGTGHAKPAALLAGSFNPLHFGHRDLGAFVGRRLQGEVHFELSVANVDKPDLPAEEIERRIAQFQGVAPVWVTRAATFVEKADLFPGAAFVVGWDTAVRLIDPKYYSNDAIRRDTALARLRDRGCRVIVAGRVDSTGLFRVWEGSDSPFRDLFDVIDEGEFRADVSSTELRKPGGGRPGAFG